MTSSLPYSHSSIPIMEGWLVKALRLVHSKKPGDQEKLKKFYKEACDNELQVSRITVAEALRESKEVCRSGTPERDVSIPTGMTRVRPANLVLTESSNVVNLSSGNTIAAVASSISGSTTPNPSGGGPTASTTTTTVAAVPSLTTAATKQQQQSQTKRTKVAFFNMFDPTSSTTSAVRANPLVGAKSTGGAIPVVDLTDPTTSTVMDSTPVISEPLSDDSMTMLPPQTTTTTTTSTTLVDTQGTAGASSDVNLFASRLVADLACRVCGKLSRPAQLEPDGRTMNSNTLEECTKCGTLYHLLCHKPPILMATRVDCSAWRCVDCSSLEPVPDSNVIVVVDEPPAAEVVITRTTTLPPTASGARKRKTQSIR